MLRRRGARPRRGPTGNLLKGDADDEQDPLDAHYAKLRTEVQDLDRSSDEFEMMERYVKNTHAATHNQYTLDVQQVRAYFH